MAFANIREKFSSPFSGGFSGKFSRFSRHSGKAVRGNKIFRLRGVNVSFFDSIVMQNKKEKLANNFGAFEIFRWIFFEKFRSGKSKKKIGYKILRTFFFFLVRR